MEIKPIKNEIDYQAALEEIESLFDAAPDTPENGRPSFPAHSPDSHSPIQFFHP